MIKHLFHLTLSACAAVILAAACQAVALEDEIVVPAEPEKPAVSQRATVPYTITVNTESTRVSYEGGVYAFKSGDKLQVVGVGRDDIEGELTQNGEVWSGELTYNPTVGELDNASLTITLVHADNPEVSTYGTALVPGAKDGNAALLQEAVEKYSLLTAENVPYSDQEVTLCQRAAFLDVAFTFNFDGSHEVEPGQALIDLEIDGKEISAQTQFYATDARNEDFQVHFMAVVPGGKTTDEFILMVGDREIEFKNTTTLASNKRYAVNRTVDYGPQLGDPFWSDGTYGRLNHSDQNASIVGIIVYVNHHYEDENKARIENTITELDAGYGHGLVMALKNVTVASGDDVNRYFAWSGSSGRVQCTGGFIITPGQTMDSPYFSGLENTNNIIVKVGNGNDSAASLAKNYGVSVATGTASSGWFLPSIGQWMYTISIDGFGNAEHADEWINSQGQNWMQKGNVEGNLVFVKQCDDERVNLLIKALNDRLAKLRSDFAQYNFEYDSFGDPTPDGNISGNYWTSTEFSETEAIRMNLGTVERYGGHYYSSIKAKREDKKTIKVYSLNGVNYQMKVRPFLAF